MRLKTGGSPVLKTVVILDLLKERLGSDYKTAKAFGVHPSRISTIRSRGIVLNDDFGLKAAQLLDFPADAMLLSLAAERAMNTETAKEIQRLAEDHYPPDFDAHAPPHDEHKKTA